MPLAEEAIAVVVVVVVEEDAAAVTAAAAAAMVVARVRLVTSWAASSPLRASEGTDLD